MTTPKRPRKNYKELYLAEQDRAEGIALQLRFWETVIAPRLIELGRQVHKTLETAPQAYTREIDGTSVFDIPRLAFECLRLAWGGKQRYWHTWTEEKEGYATAGFQALSLDGQPVLHQTTAPVTLALPTALSYAVTAATGGTSR